MTHNLEKIRIKCAELVGYDKQCREVIWWNPKLGNYFDFDELPNYPASADAALELVAWMARPENGGYVLRADNIHGEWRVETWTTANTPYREVKVISETFPLAICLAFLKANNINPETL